MISIYKQVKQIDIPDGTDMVQEIYIPAIVKIYFKEYDANTKDKAKPNSNYIENTIDDSLSNKFFEFYKIFKKSKESEKLSFTKFIKQKTLGPSNFLDVVFEFYERMVSYEETKEFMDKLDFGSFIRSLF